jgi:hypothetical protein
MLKPKSIKIKESLQSDEVKAARVVAMESVTDKSIKEDESDALVKAYNCMPNATPLLTRKQYRAAWPGLSF